MSHTEFDARTAVIRAVGGVPALGLVFCLTVLLSCSSAAPPATSTPTGDWLGETGFADRDSWPSALLHMDRKEIASANSLSGVLAGLEGLAIHTPGSGSFGIEQVQPDGEGACRVHVYMNGNRTSPHPVGGRSRLDDVFPMRAIQGLEYHVGSEGPVFEEDECGSLLFWSEEMRTHQDRPFRGTIEGTVLSSSPDSVIRVELEPTGARGVPGPEGGFSFPDLLPGEYELVFFTRSEAIARATLRVFAFQGSRLDLEIGKEGRRR
ncbi:MAG: carboxypeptidase regulatory-like domain-containing protein [Gemmatimonadetes bacterium]|nr:carboxypeptidase-like regulatory domain-containing protein [Gemmatimonadota bacterium]NNM07520.1 carboxypeptidase regulatory-like domain-containing protein [Gemmatimonadota bacterium]